MDLAKIGRLGCWTAASALPIAEATALAEQLEEWGYSALWNGEAMGADPFPFFGYLAARTEKLVFATGIANIYGRDPSTYRSLQHTMAEISGDRAILGLGVSHAPLVEMRGHDYAKPIATMRQWLDGIEQAQYAGPAGELRAPIVVAALRPKMLALSAERCAGAHPYNVPPEHTARARELMGPDAWIAPDQKVILETDASRAREAGRKALSFYLTLPNYVNCWRWLGFEDADFEHGGSDRLIDAVFAWGDEKQIHDRLQAHFDAGANHVGLQPIRADGEFGCDMNVLETFAPAKN